MKQTTFVTTFSEEGYHEYGARWVDTFIKNTLDVNAIIYTDFDLSVTDPRITVLNYDCAIPEHKQWIDAYNKACDRIQHNLHEKRFGIKFSYKSFVINHALTNTNGYVIWLDGDCVFKPNSYNNFAQSLLNNHFIAIQVDKVYENDTWKTEDHVESGIVVFNSDHADKTAFLHKFTELYDPCYMAAMTRPYDGFVIMRACVDIQYIDLLPPNYSIADCDPELTFIHPELKQRFVHYIGNKGY